MEKIAFRMTLRPGSLQEYRRRHDEIWPELVVLLRDAGISDYSIYHDPDTHALFATLWRTVPHQMDTLHTEPVMQRWWDYMADLMETEPDHSPHVTPLDCVFQLS